MFTVKTIVTEEEVKGIIEVLNDDVYEEDDEEELTFEEVKDNPSLLEYICTCYVECDNGSGDVDEIWNMDGFCDWKDYR